MQRTASAACVTLDFWPVWATLVLLYINCSYGVLLGSIESYCIELTVIVPGVTIAAMGNKAAHSVRPNGGSRHTR